MIRNGKHHMLFKAQWAELKRYLPTKKSDFCLFTTIQTGIETTTVHFNNSNNIHITHTHTQPKIFVKE